MGVFVSDGVLPSGIPISNVYMSFSGSMVYVEPKNPNDLYTVRAFCKVFKDQESKTSQPDITFQVVNQVSDISVSVFQSLYETLKQIYPDSVDC
jgi:hypothetical protein